MKRVATVVLIALLTAAISGLDDASLARAEQGAQTADAHRQEIASRLKDIPVNSVVRIERTDGQTFNALLEDVTPDAITFTVLEGSNRAKETILIDEIQNIERVRGHKLRNVLIGVGIGAAVLVGTCAAALNSTTSQPLTRADGDARP